MHDMPMVTGTPWLDYPLTLEAHRSWTCDYATQEECDYYRYRWRFWYEADLVYALPTVGLFMAVISFFTLLYAAHLLLPASIQRSVPLRQVNIAQRYLSYRVFRLDFLNWNTAPLGILVLGIVGALYFILMELVPQPYYWPQLSEGGVYGDSPALATRSGWLSLACLPFVIATAGKSNLITLVTGVSYERLQVFHRWTSYAFFVTALMHTFPFIVYQISQGTMVDSWNTQIFYWTGTVALIAQAYLTFASMGPLRSLSYEWFKFSHFVAALVFVLFLFFHCDAILTAWDYFIAAGVLFTVSWLHRQIRTYFENGVKHEARLSTTSNGFIKVTVPTTIRWIAGQHFFVRFYGLGIHTLAMHPFSVCSLPAISSLSQKAESELVFYIRQHRGLTGRLHKLAEKGDGKISLTLDGPYGGIEMQQIEKSDNIVLIAGGSGAGWILPMVSGYLRRLQIAARTTDSEIVNASLRIIVASRDGTTADWIQETVGALFEEYQIDGRTANVNVTTHHTGDVGRLTSSLSDDDIEKTAAVNVQSRASEDDSTMTGIYTRSDERPDLPAIIDAVSVASQRDQNTAVFVCGPLSMQHDVSNSVAKQQLSNLKGERGSMTLHVEHFSWA